MSEPVRFTRVRNDFIERPDLSPAEKLAAIYLCGRMRADGKPWEVNRDQVQAALGIGHGAVKTALRGLKEKGC